MSTSNTDNSAEPKAPVLHDPRWTLFELVKPVAPDFPFWVRSNAAVPFRWTEEYARETHGGLLDVCWVECASWLSEAEAKVPIGIPRFIGSTSAYWPKAPCWIWDSEDNTFKRPAGGPGWVFFNHNPSSSLHVDYTHWLPGKESDRPTVVVPRSVSVLASPAMRAIVSDVRDNLLSGSVVYRDLPDSEVIRKGDEFNANYHGAPWCECSSLTIGLTVRAAANKDAGGSSKRWKFRRKVPAFLSACNLAVGTLPADAGQTISLPRVVAAPKAAEPVYQDLYDEDVVQEGDEFYVVNAFGRESWLETQSSVGKTARDAAASINIGRGGQTRFRRQVVSLDINPADGVRALQAKIKRQSDELHKLNTMSKDLRFSRDHWKAEAEKARASRDRLQAQVCPLEKELETQKGIVEIQRQYLAGLDSTEQLKREKRDLEHQLLTSQQVRGQLERKLTTTEEQLDEANEIVADTQPTLLKARGLYHAAYCLHYRRNPDRSITATHNHAAAERFIKAVDACFVLDDRSSIGGVL